MSLGRNRVYEWDFKQVVDFTVFLDFVYKNEVSSVRERRKYIDQMDLFFTKMQQSSFVGTHILKMWNTYIVYL